MIYMYIYVPEVILSVDFWNELTLAIFYWLSTNSWYYMHCLLTFLSWESKFVDDVARSADDIWFLRLTSALQILIHVLLQLIWRKRFNETKNAFFVIFCVIGFLALLSIHTHLNGLWLTILIDNVLACVYECNYHLPSLWKPNLLCSEYFRNFRNNIIVFRLL